MIHRRTSHQEDKVFVTFELPACLWIEKAYLVGDFNDWDEASHPFHQDRDGTWRITLELERGQEYAFRYLMDGEWRNEWHADSYAPNPYGGHNSVVVT